MTNVIYERYVFNKQTQEQGESLDHYLTDIMKQADLCKYGVLKDELIRDRLVSSIKNDRIRERLLIKKDLTMTQAIEVIKASEATQMQAQDMATSGQDSSNIVQVVKANPRRKQSEDTSRQQMSVRPDESLKPCRYCGRKQV